MFARLKPQPARDRADLLPPAVLAAVRSYVPDALVFEIDPAHSDTETLCEVYELPMDVMGNAVLVSGRRDGLERRACCLTLAHRRVDVNGLVRKRLDVRKASFAPMEVAVAESGMEFGGITPVGLPDDWPIWLDAAVADSPLVCIGAGVRAAKLVVPGSSLLNLPGSERIEGLAREV